MIELTRLTGAIFILMFTSSCGSSTNDWPARHGQVIDENSETPIEGAHVVAFWKGIASYATEACFHVESTVSDIEGNFTIPAWTNSGEWTALKDQRISFTIYKNGYVESDKTYGKEQTHKSNKFYLSPTSSKDRISDINDLIQYKDCPESGDSRQNLLPFLKSAMSDASDTAKTNKDKLVVITLQRMIDSIEVGEDAAWEIWRNKKKELGIR